MALPLTSFGATIIVEPDDYPDGTELTSIDPMVTLRIDTQFPESEIFARTSSQAPTGDKVFANVSRNFWFSEQKLRADFAQPVSMVSIIVQGSGAGGTGRFLVFDKFHQGIGYYMTSWLSGGASETIQLSRPEQDIAYMVVYGSGYSQSTFQFDHLVYQIPEPSSVWPAGIAMIGLLRRRK